MPIEGRQRCTVVGTVRIGMEGRGRKPQSRRVQALPLRECVEGGGGSSGCGHNEKGVPLTAAPRTGGHSANKGLRRPSTAAAPAAVQSGARQARDGNVLVGRQDDCATLTLLPLYTLLPAAGGHHTSPLASCEGFQLLRVRGADDQGRRRAAEGGDRRGKGGGWCAGKERAAHASRSAAAAQGTIAPCQGRHKRGGQGEAAGAVAAERRGQTRERASA